MANARAACAKAEQARIRAHLGRALEMLAKRDLSSLTPAQRRARTRVAALLRRYRARGRFPKNRDFPGRRVPYFRDADGTLCAVAQLMEDTERGDLVDRIATTRNNAYVAELIDVPGVSTWLDDHGLTVEEAATIQPNYKSCSWRYDDYSYHPSRCICSPRGAFAAIGTVTTTVRREQRTHVRRIRLDILYGHDTTTTRRVGQQVEVEAGPDQALPGARVLLVRSLFDRKGPHMGQLRIHAELDERGKVDCDRDYYCMPKSLTIDARTAAKLIVAGGDDTESSACYGGLVDLDKRWAVNYCFQQCEEGCSAAGQGDPGPLLPALLLVFLGLLGVILRHRER